MRTSKTLLVLTVFLCSLMPLQSISATQDPPTLRVRLFEDACGGQYMDVGTLIVYETEGDNWIEITRADDTSDHLFATNLVLGKQYHVEAYSENMLVASGSVLLQTQHTQLQLCNEDTAQRVQVNVAVYDDDAPLVGWKCSVYGYNHYATPHWAWQATNDRYSNSQGICSWELYPSTQNTDLDRGEKYKITFEHDNVEFFCERYVVPTIGYPATLVFDISSEQSEQKDCDRLLSTHLQDLQDGDSQSICNPFNDGNSGKDAGGWFNKVSINPTSVNQGGSQLFHGCLGGDDRVDVYTYDAEQYATITLYDENDVVQFTSHSSSMVSVGGGSTTELTVQRKTSTNNYAAYQIEVVVDSERTNEFLSITQPRLMNLGPEVINCVSGGKASLLYNVADPQGHLAGDEIIVLGQTTINSDVTAGIHEEHVLDHCPEGAVTLELRSDSSETLDSLTFYFTEFDVLDTTDNVLFTDQSAFIYLNQALKPENCISFVQVSQRDALNSAAGLEEGEIRTSSSPWMCGAGGVYKWQFQGKFLGSLSNTLLINYKTGIGATPQLIYQTDIYVLPRCSEVLEEEGLSSIDSYLFIDCEGNEAGLVVYVDNGAGDLMQNKWEILNNWDEKENLLFFSKTTVITESGDSFSHVPLLVPTLVPRCRELDQSLTQLRDLDPGPGGIWNWVDVVGTAPEFAESFSNYNEVEQRLSSSVLSGDCMVQSEYHRSLGHSLAVLPVIDDWQSMAFLPATDTSTQRLLEWCGEELLRCDPVTRTNNHVQWDGVECSSYLEYSIVLTYQYDDPLAASFQWDGPMSKYDPSQPQVWYDQATECLGVELLRKAQFEQSLDMLFLLIDIISVAGTIASGGSGAGFFLLGGIIVKNSAKNTGKEVSERAAKEMYKISKSPKKGARETAEDLASSEAKLKSVVEKLNSKHIERADELRKRIDTLLDRNVLKDSDAIHVRHQIAKILKQTKGGNDATLDYIDDFLGRVLFDATDQNKIESALLELDVLAHYSTKIKIQGKFLGPSKWDVSGEDATKRMYRYDDEFSGSKPDFLFENAGRDGKHLVVEVKTTIEWTFSQHTSNGKKQLGELLSKSDKYDVVFATRKFEGGPESIENLMQMEDFATQNGPRIFDILHIPEPNSALLKVMRYSYIEGKLVGESLVPSIAITALAPWFLLPSADERGRSVESQFYHISSTCSDESFLLSSYGTIDAGVLWAYATLDDEGIKIHHEADCEILIEGVEWSTEVHVDEESGEVVPVNRSVSNPRYMPIGPVYSVDQSGSFQNIPPMFKSLNPFTSTAIIRGDDVQFTSYYLDIAENERDEDLLRYDFSNAVTDLDGALDDMQLQVGISENCNYRDYFFIQTQGLNLTLTPVPNASTDMVMGTAPHQIVPQSGFYCSILLLVYDSPFPPPTYPGDAEYIQGIGATTLHVRLSDTDGQVEEQDVEVNIATNNDLLGFILFVVLAGILVLLRRQELDSRV